ncbi:hypothetical protein J6590_010781 [Homalodisca vitripennis]|nr:hypothetical protein J6590_010781 [Homalodisca vitripennis]
MRLKQRALPRCQSESRTNKSLMSLSRQGIDIVVDRVICRGGRDNNNSRRCSIVYPPSSGARWRGEVRKQQVPSWSNPQPFALVSVGVRTCEATTYAISHND